MSYVLKVCDVRVGVVPVVMWVQVCYWNAKDSLYIPLLAGCRLLGAEQHTQQCTDNHTSNS